MNEASIHLITRKLIRATPERLFEAWTTPAQLMRWWGPQGVTCSHAEVDLREGGRYRIANLMPSGDTVWIQGVFEQVEPPRKLVYSWSLDPDAEVNERVTVRFEPRPTGCEVIVLHERIASEAAKTQHRLGWTGCLEGLASIYG